MSDDTTTPADDQPQDAEPQTQGDDTTPSDDTADKNWQAEADKWKALARRHEQRARDNAGAAAELAQVKQAHMTEQERAVHTAREEGRAEARAETAGLLVDARFEAAAAGRTVNGRPLDVAALLEGVNRAYYLTEAGQVDVEKVTRFVDNVAPLTDSTATPRRATDLGQGPRHPSRTSAGDQFAGVVEGLFR